VLKIAKKGFYLNFFCSFIPKKLTIFFSTGKKTALKRIYKKAALLKRGFLKVLFNVVAKLKCYIFAKVP